MKYQSLFSGDNMHEISKSVFWRQYARNIKVCFLKTICLKYQSLFSGDNMSEISKPVFLKQYA